jgi:hypothetical protein
MTFENLRPNGSYEHEGFQPDPPEGIDAVVDKLAAAEHNSTVNDRTTPSTRAPHVPLPDRIDDDRLQLFTSRMAGDEDSATASALFDEILTLAGQYEDATREFYGAEAASKRAATESKIAARAALEAGLAVPDAVFVDVDHLRATASAKASALSEMLAAARARYTAACAAGIPATRARLAAELPSQIQAVRDAWSAFEEANDLRWETVEALREINMIADKSWRDWQGRSVTQKRRDRDAGGSLELDPYDVQSITDRMIAARKGIDAVADVIGSRDVLVDGSYVADLLGNGTPYPTYWRRRTARTDAQLLAEIERAHGVVDLDAAVEPAVEVAVEPTASTKRTRKRSA